MNKDPYSIVKRPILTEKGTIVRDDDNIYVFAVSRDANKIEIKQAIEKLFKVKVLNVNTLVQPGKNKRVNNKMGKTSKIKKAYVKLSEEHSIDFYEGV